MIELLVPRERAGLRLDRFLALELPDFSRSRLQALIEGGFVRLNAAVPRTREIVKTGDAVTLEVPAPEKIEAEAEEIALQILFEDDDLLVLDKPAGMVVHPGAGNREHTLVNALLHHCTALSGIGGKERPGIVHRLDKETSGCLVVAKNDQAHRELSRQFAARTMTKTYLALVAGRLEKSQRHDRRADCAAPDPSAANGDRALDPWALRADRLQSGARGHQREPGGVCAAQRTDAPDPGALASSWASGFRRQALRRALGESLSTPNAARLAAGVHAPDNG